LVNSKIQFLIQKSIFFAFGPTNLTGPLGLWLSRPRWPLSPLQGEAVLAGPSSRASVASLRKYVFPFGSCLPSQSLLSHLFVKRAPTISSVFHPAPVVSPPNSPAPPAPHLGMPPEPLPPHHHSPPLNPPLNLAPVFNGIKAINAAVTTATPLRRPLAPIKAPEDPRSILPLIELLSSPLPRSTPPLPPLGRRPWTPEQPEDKALASPVPPSTAGPPWTEAGRGPRFCGPSPRNFCSKINPGKS
jgi:hypothetical protein